MNRHGYVQCISKDAHDECRFKCHYNPGEYPQKGLWYRGGSCGRPIDDPIHIPPKQEVKPIYE